VAKLFNINAGIRLPDSFVGDHEEALTYLLYEIQRQNHIKQKERRSKDEGKSILAWLQETNEDLWFSISLMDESFLTEEDQDVEDLEIESIVSFINEQSDNNEEN
jgi:hypothetical protein